MKKPTDRKRATRPTVIALPATKRPVFFDGRFLTADDLAAEQNYHRTPERRPVRRPAVIPDKSWRELQIIGGCLGKRRSRHRVLLIGANRNAKRLGALAIARELPLYRIDLGAILNKYIEETEKNLARVFDRAEQAGAVLFFEEAEALLGKRTEVNDSHDRYTNIQIKCLLQRLEDFPGSAILAIRRRENLEAAFLRRFHWTVSLGEDKPSPVRAP